MNDAIGPVGTPPDGTEKNGAGKARASLITLSFNEDDQCVYAELIPSVDASVNSLESLRRQLQEAGFGNYYINDDSLQPVVLKANKAEPGRFVVAERRDASLQWQVADNKQAVHLTVKPAYGGRAVSESWLRSDLREMRVPEPCVLQAALDEVCAVGQAEHVCVAKAQEPTPGEDTRFEVLIESRAALIPGEDSQGRIDMHQLHDFIVVEPGAPLMRRIPPTSGEPGLTVVGTVIPPVPGKDLSFSGDLEGAEPSPNNPNLLVAVVKGHPVPSSRGVRVDPMLRLKDVNLSTGNIHFDGSVEVSGDVTSGFTVQATGDIFVRGMVEKAQVIARRDLVIQGGVMGEDRGRDDAGELILPTRLQAGGNLSAKFINLAEVVAGKDIHVREYVMQCYLSAGGSVLLGQAGGKGCVIGGRTRAGASLVANILGSDANVATDIRIGKANKKRRLLEQLRKAWQQSESSRKQLRESMAGLRQAVAQSAKLTELQEQLELLTQRQQRLRSIAERLLGRQKGSPPSLVDVKRKLYANVSIAIDGVVHTYTSDLGPRRLVRSGAELVSR